MAKLWVGFVFDLAAEPLSQRYCDDVLAAGLPGAPARARGRSRGLRAPGGLCPGLPSSTPALLGLPQAQHAQGNSGQLKTAPRPVEHLQMRAGTALSWSAPGGEG